MSTDYVGLEDMLDRIKLLPPEYRLRLMQGILETLVPVPPKNDVKVLEFGEYKDFDGPMSNLEDYAIAEWRPTVRELNGE